METENGEWGQGMGTRNGENVIAIRTGNGEWEHETHGNGE